MLIFKTNVSSPHQASKLINGLRQALNIPFEASFDLEDCDCVLRLYSPVPLEKLINKILEIISAAGVSAEILQDEVPVKAIASPQDRLSLKLLSSLI